MPARQCDAKAIPPACPHPPAEVGSAKNWWPDLGGGLEASGRPAPLFPQRPSLSAAAEVPLPEPDTGPGIVYAIGHT